MASVIGKRIDEVVKIGLAPLLKEHGFTRKSRTFRKAAGEAIQIVNVQANKWNQGDSGSFTINLGVYFRAIEELADESITDLPGPGQFTASTRLGQLLPNPRDKWWKLRPKRWWEFSDRFTPDNAAIQVVDALHRYGLPWLERTNTCEGLREAFSHPAVFTSTIKPIALELLDRGKDEAAKRLRQEIADTGNPGHVEYLSEWGRKHGLI